jgi:predicted ABC-type ATPase
VAVPHKRRPVLTIIAGPNGSGKTTKVSQLLRIGALGILVNADDITALCPLRVDSH